MRLLAGRDAEYGVDLAVKLGLKFGGKGRGVDS